MGVNRRKPATEQKRTAAQIGAAFMALPLTLSMTMSLTSCSDRVVTAEYAPQTESELAFRDGQPSIRIVSPTNGAVSGPEVEVEIEVTGLELQPAGVTADLSGHVHLFIDRSCYRPGEVIPAGLDNIVHLGDGTTKRVITLPPGSHKICAVLGDGYHVALSLQHTVEFEVAEAAASVEG